MFQTLLVIVIGFLPSLFSLWMIRKAQRKTRMRIRQAANNFSRMRRLGYLQASTNDTADSPDRFYLDGVGYMIGDISCQYNARSGYIRCAINPSGPCDSCHFYEERNITYS
ncbi:DUF6464 family protein [Calothrix sp. PCC 6303]|uniref:DUF6464 family protein n=1 Tax=Calothrix sp. PCC 6303 TaxID=1170562 RepID=UPI0002A01A18|nr:DUF6464 family protein [Calothrix sp. PCC 6303]AFZ04169.1 hypothetical protein Cal6303_5283 [Calothrix sp. PCC 6303]